MPAPEPQALVKYVAPSGTLSREGIQLLLAYQREIEALRARVAALEAQG